MAQSFKFVYILFYRLTFIWVKGGMIALKHFTRPRAHRESQGMFFKRICEGLGGTFIKVGQALAMRQDFLPSEDCETLSGLLDRVKEFPSHQGHAIVESQLGGKLSQFFSEFSEKPIASASFSQVYRARTLDGELVAVKVMRPGMPMTVKADTTLLLATAYFFELLGLGKRIGIMTLVREIVKVLQDELNYEREGRYLQIFQDHARKFDYLDVPKYFRKLSGTKVLTMTFIEGTTLRDYLTQVRADRKCVVRDIQGFPIDGPLVGSRIYEVTMHSVFELGFYHADLHPGNIVLLPGNRIGFIDFGIVGVLGKDLREKNLKYIEALTDGRLEDAAAVYSTIVRPHVRADYAGLQEDMLILLKAWAVATADPEASFKEKSSGTILNESVEFARRHRFYLARNAVLYYKTIMMIDHLNIELNPAYDSIAEAEKFIYDYRIQKMANALSYEKLVSNAAGIVDSLELYPDAVSNGLRYLQNIEPRRSKSPFVLISEQLVRLLRNCSLMAGIAWPILALILNVDWLPQWNPWLTITVSAFMFVIASQLNAVLVKLVGDNPPTD